MSCARIKSEKQTVVGKILEFLTFFSLCGQLNSFLVSKKNLVFKRWR